MNIVRRLIFLDRLYRGCW